MKESVNLDEIDLVLRWKFVFFWWLDLLMEIFYYIGMVSVGNLWYRELVDVILFFVC